MCARDIGSCCFFLCVVARLIIPITRKKLANAFLHYLLINRRKEWSSREKTARRALAAFCVLIGSRVQIPLFGADLQKASDNRGEGKPACGALDDKMRNSLF